MKYKASSLHDKEKPMDNLPNPNHNMWQGRRKLLDQDFESLVLLLILQNKYLASWVLTLEVEWIETKYELLSDNKVKT